VSGILRKILESNRGKVDQGRMMEIFVAASNQGVFFVNVRNNGKCGVE
jgi:hypothetical protein